MSATSPPGVSRLRGAVRLPDLEMPTGLIRGVVAVVAYLAAMDVFGLLEVTSVSGIRASLPTITNGGSAGMLYGLVAVGLILIYRTNRIINFAVAAVGALPAVFAILLSTIKGVPWILTMPLALAGGAAIGAGVDIVVMRRFAQAPRLIATVATFGVSQILAFISLYVPIWLGADDGIAPRLDTPFSDLRWSNAAGVPYGSGDNLAAVVVVVVAAIGLATFFTKSRLGIALRAAAENADRASLLGIPVRRVQTLAWSLAGLFGATVIYFRSPITGTPVDGSLGFSTLLFALAAAVIARMESIPTALLAGVGVGILEFATVKETGESSLASAVMLVFILVALLFQRAATARAADTGVSTWKALQEFRPIPPELRSCREVHLARSVFVVLVAAVFVVAPFVAGSARLDKLTLLPIHAIIGVSLVVLTGWSGQISLGQFAFVGVGAVTAARLFVDNGWDFWLTLFAAAVAGALVAVLVGLPALRIQGLLLAVSSFALAAAAEGYLFVDKGSKYVVGRAVLPSSEGLATFRSPILWERIDLANSRTYYYFCVVILALVFLAATSYRRHHSGRVLIATRDNTRAAQSYSVNLVRTRIAAFAVSGAMAAVAGTLLAYQQRAIDPETYGIGPSITVFMATVIGGLTSLAGATAGVLFVYGITLFGDNLVDGLSLLVTGPGLLLVLLFLPGGLAEGAVRIRDGFLRWVATRHRIRVPSLFADDRPDEAPLLAPGPAVEVGVR